MITKDIEGRECFKMLEIKLNKNALLSSERRQENNENYDNATQFSFKRKKYSTYKLKKGKIILLKLSILIHLIYYHISSIINIEKYYVSSAFVVSVISTIFFLN